MFRNFGQRHNYLIIQEYLKLCVKYTVLKNCMETLGDLSTFTYKLRNMTRYEIRHGILKALSDYYDLNIRSVAPSDRGEETGLEISDLQMKLNLSFDQIYSQLEFLSAKKQVKFNIGLRYHDLQASGIAFEFEFYTITELGKASYHDLEYPNAEEKEQQEKKREQRASNTFKLSIAGFLFTIIAFAFTQISKNNDIDNLKARLDSVEHKMKSEIEQIRKIQTSDSIKSSK